MPSTGKPRAAAALQARQRGQRAGPELRHIVWGPSGLYPAGGASSAGLSFPAPAYEVHDVKRWVHDFPELAARVRIPLRYSLGDHERVWSSGPAALADIAAFFTAAPLVAVHEQAHAGHNLSLGLSAMAYHLTVLAFAEECAIARSAPAPELTGGSR